MKALIDSDILQYEYGAGEDAEGRPIPWPFVQARVQAKIDFIVEKTEVDDYQLYLTSDDKSNFRYSVATIKPYKGNRSTPKPKYYQHIRNFLKDHRGALEIHGMEADDAMAITQWKEYRYDKELWPELIVDGTIICSLDKDLDMVPGWHYNWRRDEKYYIEEIDGFRNFYCQLLTGDTVDNIPGCYGIGKSSKLLKDIKQCETEDQMHDIVFNQYYKRFGNYAYQFLIENGQLLWMLQEEGQRWKPKYSLEESIERLNQNKQQEEEGSEE